MALIVRDRVMETTTTTGTGSLSLAGAYTGYQAFDDVCANGDTVYYCIEALDSNGNPSGDWEVGLGTFNDTDTLARTSVHASSNSNNAVNFAAGTKRVSLDATGRFLRSVLGREVIQVLVTDPAGDDLETGDGKAYVRVPAKCSGFDLVAVAAAVTTASSSGTPTIQIYNVTQAADMLSTRITIDANETDSSTAASAAAIDTGNDDVATGDLLRIDVDTAGTGTKGLIVEMTFQLP
jgi:hypothetical protein